MAAGRSPTVTALAEDPWPASRALTNLGIDLEHFLEHRRRQNLLGLPVSGDTALRHHDHAVRVACRQVQIMGDGDDGDTVPGKSLEQRISAGLMLQVEKGRSSRIEPARNLQGGEGHFCSCPVQN